MNYFEQFIFNEASPTNNFNKKNQQNPNNIKPPSTPPDFTKEQDPKKEEQQDSQQNSNNIDNQNQEQDIPDDANTDDQIDTKPQEEPNDMGLDDTGTGEDDLQGPSDGSEEDMGTGEEDPNAMGDEETQEPDDDSKIFGSLTPEQIEIKKSELKTQYKNLYDAINSSLNGLDNISRTTEDSVLISFVIKKLLELRTLTNDSLIKSFKLRSYIENQIELKKLIASYEMILKIINNINDFRVKLQLQSNKVNKKRRSAYMGFTQNLNVN